MFRLACKLRNADVPESIAESLIVEAARKCQPPFSESDALVKVRRVFARYEPKNGTEKANPRKGFSLVDAKDLLASEEPETEWLWEGILPCGGLSLLVAKPKVGKTTLAFRLALAVTSGAEFLGRSTRQGEAIYLPWKRETERNPKKAKSFG